MPTATGKRCWDPSTVEAMARRSISPDEATQRNHVRQFLELLTCRRRGIRGRARRGRGSLRRYARTGRWRRCRDICRLDPDNPAGALDYRPLALTATQVAIGLIGASGQARGGSHSFHAGLQASAGPGDSRGRRWSGRGRPPTVQIRPPAAAREIGAPREGPGLLKADR